MLHPRSGLDRHAMTLAAIAVSALAYSGTGGYDQAAPHPAVPESAAPSRALPLQQFSQTQRTPVEQGGSGLRVLSPKYSKNSDTGYTYGAKYPVARFDGRTLTDKPTSQRQAGADPGDH